MTDNVISLDERRKKKQRDNPVVDVIRQSLDNDAVMRRYGIKPKEKPPEPTVEERMHRIRESCARINSLMAELKENQK